MGIPTKNKKPNSNKPQNDADTLKSDVASFASSLGLSSSIPDSGFNDSDFRKSGPLPHNKKPDRFNQTGKKPDPKNAEKFTNKKFSTQKPRVQEVLSVENSKVSFEKFKNLPKLPLVKATGLGVWYVDEKELEEKLFGVNKVKLDANNVEERKVLVEKKKKLGERLLAQYVSDYESSRGQSGDIKMLVATQRSGTATDKVSAFSVMIGDNAIANIKALDALLGSL